MINSPHFDAIAAFNTTARPDLTKRTTDRIIEELASTILDDDSALSLDDIDDLADLLTARAFMRLCIALDLCPYHRCDIDTCNDDDRDCAANLDLFDN